MTELSLSHDYQWSDFYGFHCHNTFPLIKKQKDSLCPHSPKSGYLQDRTVCVLESIDLLTAIINGPFPRAPVLTIIALKNSC